jgi:hypothetical protein
VIVVCVSVVDAAMVVGRGTPEQPRLTLEPWVRVVRQEAVEEHNWWGRKHYVVDFVHRAFISTYASAHVLPFANGLAERMLEKEGLVIAGKASVFDWEAWQWKDLQPVP